MGKHHRRDRGWGKYGWGERGRCRVRVSREPKAKARPRLEIVRIKQGKWNKLYGDEAGKLHVNVPPSLASTSGPS